MRRKRLAGCAVVLLVGAAGLWWLREQDSNPQHWTFFDAWDEEERAGVAWNREMGSTRVLVTSRAAVESAAAHRSVAKMDWSMAWVNFFEQEFGHYDHIDVSEVSKLPGKRRTLIVDANADWPVDPLGLGILVGLTGTDRDRAFHRDDGTFARQLVELQQGVPANDDFTLEKTLGFYDWCLETHDLASITDPRHELEPLADRLEFEMLMKFRRTEPLPRWWYFPDAAPGLLLMTHDEDAYGAEQCDLLLEHELEIGARSTTFLIPFPRMDELWSDADVARYRDAGNDLQLHWNRDAMVSGFWKVEPTKRVFGLDEQLELLERTLGARPEPLINRNHYLIWESLANMRSGDSDWARTFRILHAAGVDMDSSYGPNRGGRGFVFGTGRPFYPLDTNGLVIPVLELPFVAQENWDGEDEAWWTALFETSATGGHSALACIFHPHLIVREEAGNALWKHVYAEAERFEHPSITMSEYHAFLAARRESPLVESWQGSFTLRVECEARSDSLWLELTGDANFAATIDGEPARTKTRSCCAGHRFVHVPRGAHTIVFTDL